MKPSLKNKLISIGRWLGIVLGAGFLLLVLFIGTVYIGWWGKLPAKKELSQLSLYKASEIYDAKNRLIGKFYIENRQPVALDSLPDHLMQALIATEDARFYKHSGVDYRSMGRVFFKSLLLQDKSAGGGSTLTQQLAKNLFARQNQGVFTLPVAKTKEIIIANRLEAIYTKPEILELYLNTVPFSGNTHGIESASRKFFNKPASQLSPSEAATLIGTLKATSYYHPKQHPQRATERRNLVLSQMAKYNYLTADSLKLFQTDSLQLDYAKFDEQSGIAPYFRERLRQELLTWCKENSTDEHPLNLYTSGLKIYTTLDKDLQTYAEQATTEHLKNLQPQMEAEYGDHAPWGDTGAAYLQAMKKSDRYQKLKTNSLDHQRILDSLSQTPSELVVEGTPLSVTDSLKHRLKSISTGSLVLDNNGAVKAYVGGADFSQVKYDHTNSKRQVGSTFKPIVYTAGLEKGMTPCSYISAREVAYENHKDWSPSNSGDIDERYMNYSLKEALTHSINTISVKVLEKTGIDEVVSLSRKLNINNEIPKVPSLALGTAELSIAEMAGAYTAFINDQRPVKPYYLLKITDADDHLIEEWKKPEVMEPAFSATTRQQMIAMMESVVDRGTATRMRSVYGLRNDIAGKTGTTQSNKDAWFMAVTPQLVVATWVGFDDHRIGFKSTRVGQGANAALPISAKLLQKMNADPAMKPYTSARFPQASDQVLSSLECEPTKRDGFFKRLFTNPDKKKKRRFKGG
ncbi:penicillin-binding protein 1A [Nonlabens xiamenensis]|uniref:penicillin-binding protein 1A n=1 Tax=Nonlabens xiamenensis TaxID=2341043 RepID=UPI000F60FAB0|nr:transglycosylase domain-containing protein [Nonlabens xiamenensis]